MALDFPNAPTIGQTYSAEGGVWVWNGIQWVAKDIVTTMGAFASPTPPTGAQSGQFWYRTVSPVGLYMWFVDANSSQWIEVSEGGSSVTSNFATRGVFAAANLDNEGMGLTDGQTITAGGLTYVRKVGATGIPDILGWIPNPNFDADLRHFAIGNWQTDCGPGLRAGCAYLKSIGGGVLSLPPADMTIRTAETRNLTGTDFNAGVFIEAGVKLRGTPGSTILRQHSGLSLTAVLAPVSYARGEISGIEIIGRGRDGNATHGIFITVASLDEKDHVTDTVLLKDLLIHDVGSYGIGNQWGHSSRCTLENIVTRDTGADGIDWKQKGTSVAVIDTESNVARGIEIRRYGMREGAGSPSGFGMRGRWQVDQISVYEITGLSGPGIQFLPGIADYEDNEFRRGTHQSSITNWYCEGVTPLTKPAVGLHVFASEVNVGPGVCKWCSVYVGPASTSPPKPGRGAVLTGVVVTPPRFSGEGVLIGLPSTSADVHITSDYDWFAVDNDSATVGQTVFTLPYGVPEKPPRVERNSVLLYTPADYTLTGATLTLTVGITDSESVCVFYPPSRGVRVIAPFCLISGSSDQAILAGVNYDTSLNVATGSRLTFFTRGRQSNMTLISSDTVTGITTAATDQAFPNPNLRLDAPGTGLVELVTPAFINIPTSPTGLPAGQLWRDNAAGNVIKIV